MYHQGPQHTRIACHRPADPTTLQKSSHSITEVIPQYHKKIHPTLEHKYITLSNQLEVKHVTNHGVVHV